LTGNKQKSICAAIDDENRLRIHLDPMPSGDNPWRTRGDYEKELGRDTKRFWMTIIALVVAIIGTTATAVTAILTILKVAG
jgi:hypothetical protein